MSRPEISSNLEATVDIFELFTSEGTMAAAVVIKQLYGYTARGVVYPVPGAEIRAVDVPWPDGQSAMFPSDLFLSKPSTDVVVAGSAVAPTGQATELDVLARVGPVSKALVVFGPRLWQRSLTGAKLSPPLPFSRLPLMWEHAFGGLDISDSGRVADEPRNPVGTGLACDSATLIDKLGPRIEDPRDLIRSSRSRPAPAGVAALGPGFQPRRGYAGTHDQRWQDERMPLPPLDFDPRFNQVAHPELVTPQHLLGGELVELLNLGVGGATHFHLPRRHPGLLVRTDSRREPLRPVLDTVLIRADDSLLELTWRSAVPLPRCEGRVRAIQVFEKEQS